jgi:UDPglucose 6-dehydrogenase
MKIAIVGTGYVGLVSGVCFAEMGNDVTCVDIDRGKVARLKKGQLPIYEPGLEPFFQRGIREGRLDFTTSLRRAIRPADVVFLALPTPPAEDGSADLSHVLGVACNLGSHLSGYTVIVTKSTVPVGTADRVRQAIESSGLRPGVDFDVVSNPEFLREGAAIEDFMRPERVVVGTSSQRAAQLISRLYEPFVRQGNPILIMDERSAELTKYAGNAFLATKISFMNEIANLCEMVGANVDAVRRGIGTDSRIGKQFLYPGLGFGGSCFPKDVSALRRTADGAGYDFRILDAVLDVNGDQFKRLVERVVADLGPDLTGQRIAVWGLAFKANTDDVRESPAHKVIEALLARGATVVAYDPEALTSTRRVLGDRIEYADGPYAALGGAEALVVCTEWSAFRRPDFATVKRLMSHPRVFDGRNLYDPEEMEEAGFQYVSVGRPGTPSEEVAKVVRAA